MRTVGRMLCHNASTRMAFPWYLIIASSLLSGRLESSWQNSSYGSCNALPDDPSESNFGHRFDKRRAAASGPGRRYHWMPLGMRACLAHPPSTKASSSLAREGYQRGEGIVGGRSGEVGADVLTRWRKRGEHGLSIQARRRTGPGKGHFWR